VTTHRPQGYLGTGVLTTVVTIGATSVTRAAALTPSALRRVRVISVSTVSNGLTTAPGRVGVWFGTGAEYVTTADNAIVAFVPGTTGFQSMVWPDGDGPLGEVDEVVSWNTTTETETALFLTIVYREEQ